MTPGLPAAGAIAGAVALAAWRARALTGAGAAAATAVGTTILCGAGWPGGAALAAFFVSSSAISRLAPAPPSPEADAKGNRRDPWQVLANGGPAALGAMLAWRTPGLALWIVTASLAAAAADTWATSAGAWSRRPPRHLFTGKAVPPGTSGGISLYGTLGALAGACLVAGAGAWAGGAANLLPAATLVGFSGMVADSALGASMQGRFRCPRCGLRSERQVHRCGTPTERVGGVAWLNNDGVNALATGIGALAGWAAWRWLSRPG